VLRNCHLVGYDLALVCSWTAGTDLGIDVAEGRQSLGRRRNLLAEGAPEPLAVMEVVSAR
jgi:hypothetical protein